MGVNLFVPVDFYSLVERALKYGLLFVAAAFGGVFVLELLSGRRVHPIQYFFVGLSIVTSTCCCFRSRSIPASR